ncbi:hypothetical protein Tco_1361223 [Tanacetum coccineum]
MFDELRPMMLLEESDMSHPSVSPSLLHNTSSLPTVLVASTTPHDKVNTMSMSGFDVCRNFQHGSCSIGSCSTMLPQAFQTLTFQQPNWNMDTGTSSHISENEAAEVIVIMKSSGYTTVSQESANGIKKRRVVREMWLIDFWKVFAITLSLD